MGFSRRIHKHIVRDASALTNSYVAGNIIGDASEYNTLALEVDLTLGSLNSAELKIEVSNDGVNYYQQVSETTSSGTTNIFLNERSMSEDGKYAFLISPIRAKFIKVSVKGTGTTTGSSCAIKAYLSWS